MSSHSQAGSQGVPLARPWDPCTGSRNFRVERTKFLSKLVLIHIWSAIRMIVKIVGLKNLFPRDWVTLNFQGLNYLDISRIFSTPAYPCLLFKGYILNRLDNDWSMWKTFRRYSEFPQGWECASSREPKRIAGNVH